MTTIIDKFSGSIDVSSDFKVNNTTLFVDSIEKMVGIGNSIPSEKLDVSGTIKATGLTINGSPFNYFPQFSILMWTGSTADIPNGWVYCDGTNGTPDLRGHFVRSTTSDGKIGQTGGSYNLKFEYSDYWIKHSHNVYTNPGTSSGNHVHYSTTDTRGHAHNAYTHRDGYGRGDAYTGGDTPGGDEGIYWGTNAGPTSSSGNHNHNNSNFNGYGHSHPAGIDGFGPTNPGNVSIRPGYYALHYIMKT